MWTPASSKQQALVSEYRAQIARIVEATVRQAGDVGQALSAMAEVDERLAGVEAAGRRLAQLRQRASRELEALLLTKRVAEARTQLEALEGRREALAQQLAELDERHPREPPAATRPARTRWRQSPARLERRSERRDRAPAAAHSGSQPARGPQREPGRLSGENSRKIGAKTLDLPGVVRYNNRASGAIRRHRFRSLR